MTIPENVEELSAQMQGVRSVVTCCGEGCKAAQEVRDEYTADDTGTAEENMEGYVRSHLRGPSQN